MIKKFTINRKKWLRGEKESCLLKRDGRMCCLGFYALARRVKRKDIVTKPAPDSLFTEKNGVISYKLPELIDKTSGHNTKICQSLFGGYFINNEICENLITFNDDEYFDDRQRESKIKHEFKKIGVAVKFVN